MEGWFSGNGHTIELRLSILVRNMMINIKHHLQDVKSQETVVYRSQSCDELLPGRRSQGAIF